MTWTGHDGNEWTWVGQDMKGLSGGEGVRDGTEKESTGQGETKQNGGRGNET